MVAMILLALYGIFDLLIYKEREILLYAPIVRFAVLLPAPLFGFLSTFIPRYIMYSQLTGSITILLSGIACCLLSFHATLLTFIYTFPVIMMVTIYSFFFVGLFLRYALGVSMVVNAIYFLVLSTTHTPRIMAIAVGVSMLTIMLLISMAAYQKELISRQLFVSESRELEAITRQHLNDSRYLAWLRQLAEFLRHEVRQPIAQISSSIEIVEVTSQNDERLKPYLARLMQRFDEFAPGWGGFG
jgi:diguanylate cyclase